MRITEFYEDVGDVIWEDTPHKDNVCSFIFEIDKNLHCIHIDKYDDSSIDNLIKIFRERGNSNATINRKLAALYKILRKAERKGLIKKLPTYVRLPEKNQRIRFLTQFEEEIMFSVIGSRNKCHEDLCLFLIDSGARVGEALGLKHGDISHGKATFWITKSGKSRTVPLTARVQDILARRTKHVGGPFSGVRYQNFLYDWKAAKKACGLQDDKDVVPHILRHTCASRLVQAGIDLRRVQTFLGHQTIQMTLRYAHLATTDLDQCVAALNSFNEKEQ